MDDIPIYIEEWKPPFLCKCGTYYYIPGVVDFPSSHFQLRKTCLKCRGVMPQYAKDFGLKVPPGYHSFNKDLSEDEKKQIL